MQRFLQKNDSKNLVLVSTESISDLPIFKLGDTEAVLEPKLMILVGPSHSSVAPRLLGFHKVLNSVRPRITCAMALAKSVEPISTTRLV